MSKTIEGVQPYFFKQENNITKKIKHILTSGKLSQGENIKMLEEKT